MLDLYARKDIAGVMNMMADHEVLIMVADLGEVCTSRADIEQLPRNDFRLWDSASFRRVNHVYTRQSGKLVSAFFDVPFTTQKAGQQQTFIIRFATVWRKSPQGLQLVESANTVLTVGQSAKEILTPK